MTALSFKVLCYYATGIICVILIAWIYVDSILAVRGPDRAQRLLAIVLPFIIASFTVVYSQTLNHIFSVVFGVFPRWLIGLLSVPVGLWLGKRAHQRRITYKPLAISFYVFILSTAFAFFGALLYVHLVGLAKVGAFTVFIVGIFAYAFLSPGDKSESKEQQ